MYNNHAMMIELIANLLGYKRSNTERTEDAQRKNESFRVELARMLYVGIIDMMTITAAYGRPPWGETRIKKI
jgi:hypothetical protein